MIERAVLLARDRVITPDLLPTELLGSTLATPITGKPSARPPIATLPTFPEDEPPTENLLENLPVGSLPPATDAGRLLEEVEQLEKARIIDALTKCNGNQTRAAQMLGITRRVLINRIERYNLPRPRGPLR